MVISFEEQGEQLQIEEKETCELIKESLIPQAIEEDEEEEAQKKPLRTILS